MVVLVQSWTVAVENKAIWIVISTSLFKKMELFMLIKEPNNSQQSLLLMGPNDFLSSSNLKYLFSLLERLWSFWPTKLINFK